MVQWKEASLVDMVELQRGYDLPLNRRATGTVPVYGSFGITGYHNEARARGPGVTVGRSGASFGVVNYSPTNYWPHNTVLFVKDFKGNDPRFVYYLLRSIDFSHLNSGSAQPSLNRNYVYFERVLLPPFPTQRKIAAILSAYDDLIENNARRIAILEQMARLLYREWFVDFRFAGHESVPMVDSPVGPIPGLWEIRPLFQVASVGYGYPFKSKLFNSSENGLPVIRIRDVKNGNTNTRTTENPGERYFVRNGDLLVGMDGEFHMGKWVGGNAYLNQRVARIRAAGPISSYHLYLSLAEPIEQLQASIVGTTVAHLSDKDLRAISVIVPDDQTARAAADLLDPILGLEINLRLENSNLRQTRDLLLPRLISGEIDVEDLDIDTEGLAA